MTQKAIFEHTATEVQLKAIRIADCGTAAQAKEEYDISSGYLCALYDAGIFNRDMSQVGADLLRAAYHEAIKKAASSARNTESGTRKNSNFSIATVPLDVKWSGKDIYQLIRSMRAARISDEGVVCVLLNVFHPQGGNIHAG